MRNVNSSSQLSPLAVSSFRFFPYFQFYQSSFTHSRRVADGKRRIYSPSPRTSLFSLTPYRWCRQRPWHCGYPAAIPWHLPGAVLTHSAQPPSHTRTPPAGFLCSFRTLTGTNMLRISPLFRSRRVKWETRLLSQPSSIKKKHRVFESSSLLGTYLLFTHQI